METLTQEKKQSVFDTCIKKLVENGVSEEAAKKLSETYGNAIREGSYSTSNEFGLAYYGSLPYISLTKLAAYAFKINGLYPEVVRVPQASIIKVALLQHISKALMLEPTKDEYKLKKLNMPFEYVKGKTSLRTGIWSMLMAMNCGVTFTEEEAEAMTIIDKDDDDIQAKFHKKTLASIIKMANEMVYIEARAN